VKPKSSLGSSNPRAAREGERLRAAILDTTPDPVITIDAHGRVLDFNRAAEETFGYTAQEATGRELAELIVPPDLRQRHREALARRVRTGEGNLLDRVVEMTGMRKDGSTFPVDLAVTRVPECEPPIFAGHVRDITERRRSEERVRDQGEEIAKLARARGELVAQLLLAEERTRRRIAQALHDDALQRLLSAHQDLIEAAPGREGVTRAHEAIEGTIDRLREAVVALHPVTLQQGDLETALSAVARQHAARGGFRYTVRVEKEASELADDLVLSIARELIANVDKHAGASRCSVSVTREGERIVLEVADDGRGMPAGRPQAALREGHIGLAAAIQRLEALGGHMEVWSEHRKGTVIRGRFPIVARASTERARAERNG
jgi:PAS domain S-box-containing protein